MTARTDERKQFLTDVLTTAIEGGINYWGGVSEYEWDVPLGEAYAVVHENEQDSIEDNEAGVRVGIDDIARGIGLALRANKDRKGYWQQFVLANRTNSEDGDYDADLADEIIQYAIFGEAIYG